MDIVDRLRCGSVLHPRRWSGDTHFDLGGSVDEDATDAVMDEAADEIERLNDVGDRMFQQIEQLISDLVDSREETRRLHRLIAAWADASEECNATDGNKTCLTACETLREEVGR